VIFAVAPDRLMRGIVIAAAMAEEDQRHQPAADQQRQQHAERERDPAMQADADAVQPGQTPGRACERQQQKCRQGGDQQARLQS